MHGQLSPANRQVNKLNKRDKRDEAGTYKSEIVYHAKGRRNALDAGKDRSDQPREQGNSMREQSGRSRMRVKTINISAHSIVPKMENSTFIYTTRCMCSFVIRRSKPINIDNASLMLIELYREPGFITRKQPIYTCNSTCRVLLRANNFASYMRMTPKDKKRTVLRWIEQTAEMCVGEGVMSSQSLDHIRESISLAGSLDYEHKYHATRPVLSPSKKLKAVVEVRHETDNCTGDMVVMDRRGSEITRSRVFEEKPDELIFKKWFTRPVWHGDLGVVLQPGWGVEPAREVSVGGSALD